MWVSSYRKLVLCPSLVCWEKIVMGPHLYLPTLLWISVDLAPRLIQSISRNVRNKKKALKRLCEGNTRKFCFKSRESASQVRTLSNFDILPYKVKCPLAQCSQVVGNIKLFNTSKNWQMSKCSILPSTRKLPIVPSSKIMNTIDRSILQSIVKRKIVLSFQLIEKYCETSNCFIFQSNGISPTVPRT